MQGLHVHVGSQILDVEPFAESVAPVAALGEFPVYDLGGGLGARYTWADEPPTRRRLPRRADRRRPRAPAGRTRSSSSSPAAAWSRARRRRSTGSSPSSAGRARSSPSTAGWATTSRSRCSTSASRPAIAGRFDAAGRRAGHRRRPPLRERRRAGRRGRRCPRPRVGDLLAVPATGAYCFTMANNYNGNRRIPVVFAATARPAWSCAARPGRPAGARRRLRRSRRRVFVAWCPVLLDRDDGEFFVVVCDEGIGMAPRTDSPGLGLGLGLIAGLAKRSRSGAGGPPAPRSRWSSAPRRLASRGSRSGRGRRPRRSCPGPAGCRT